MHSASSGQQRDTLGSLSGIQTITNCHHVSMRRQTSNYERGDPDWLSEVGDPDEEA